jgi:leucyl/phenylalanyl-tRNA---protein transferase
MPIHEFPHPSTASPDGIVAVGGDLHPQSLMLAYRSGIFPWPIEGLPLTWFSPAKRAVLFFKDLHVSRSLRREQSKSKFTFTINRDFNAVIEKCAASRSERRQGTWITSAMIIAYKKFHKLGHAHSVEVWKEKKLVGGLYGVDAGGLFAGESMFFEESNASKLAVLYIVDYLKGKGAQWMDIQDMTPHMKALGAKTIPRDQFLNLLTRTLSFSQKLF